MLGLQSVTRVPKLSCFYALFTDGPSPRGDFAHPRGATAFVEELKSVPMPSGADEVFGSYASAFARAQPKKAYLLGLSKDVKGAPGRFFTEARTALLQAIAGLDGWGLDVLKLTPFPFKEAAEAVPEEFLAEDLFSVGFTEMGVHGYRAETFGFSKVGQRELSFEFHGKGLIEEAGLFCGHLADWILEHGLRVEHAQGIAFGFDKVGFFAAEGKRGETFRAWHPPLIRQLLEPTHFEGVGVLEVRASDGPTEPLGDLTAALTHTRMQRRVLDDFDLTGDAPHHTATAVLHGEPTGLVDLVAMREEPDAARDSGWRLATTAGATQTGRAVTLAQLVQLVPEMLRYLALPPGSRLEWDINGRHAVDVSHVAAGEADDGDD